MTLLPWIPSADPSPYWSQPYPGTPAAKRADLLLEAKREARLPPNPPSGTWGEDAALKDGQNMVPTFNVVRAR